MSTVNLIDGTPVDSGSAAWRDECLARWRHVQTLLGINGQGSLELRRTYLSSVAAAEGTEARRRLEVDFAEAWAKRQGAAS